MVLDGIYSITSNGAFGASPSYDSTSLVPVPYILNANGLPDFQPFLVIRDCTRVFKFDVLCSAVAAPTVLQEFPDTAQVTESVVFDLEVIL